MTTKDHTNRPVRLASIGEAMIELSDLSRNDGRVALKFAGDTLNTAIYLARATDAVAVSYVTRVGTDQFSDQMIRLIADEGIGTSLIGRSEHRLPGIYAIELDPGGERSFRYWRDASAARTLFADGAPDIDDLGAFDALYLSGITLAILDPAGRMALIAACAEAKAAGKSVIFDSNYRPALWPDADTARASFVPMWRATTIALPSRDDEAMLWPGETPKDLLSRLAGLGVAEIALKDGAGGPWLWQDGALPRKSYPPAATVVDTTAAGDSFNAGYLAARLGDGATPQVAARAGHDLAARVIGKRGAIVDL